MGNKYHQLTEQDRIFISLMLERHYSKAKIAKILNVDTSTIYREIKRNSVVHWRTKLRSYWSMAAHEKAIKRRKKGLMLDKNSALRQYVHGKLEAGWSPYQIEGRLKRDNDGRCIISHESIYHYIYSDPDRRYLLHKYLRRKHRYRVKKGQRKPRIPNNLMISERPGSVNDRSEFGHWECDLMVFKKGTKANLITLRERQTRYMIAIKNENRKANGTAMALISTISKIKQHVKSITFDQGSEFQRYEWIKNCIGTDIYFCEPASPYQKGAVENGNANIRIEFQRDYDVENLKQHQIYKVIDNINNRPLKCLDYLSPKEIFERLVN